MSVMVLSSGGEPDGTGGARTAGGAAHRLPAPGVCWVMAPLGRYVADAGVSRAGSRAAMPATASPCAPAPLLLAGARWRGRRSGAARRSRQVVKTGRPASPAGGATRAGRAAADEHRAAASRPASARAGPGTEPGSGRCRTEQLGRLARQLSLCH